jgi:hypothetical protein
VATLIVVAPISCLDYGEVSVGFDNEVAAEVPAKTVTDRNGERITLVRASINDEDLGWFMLVSGSYFCIIDSRHVPRIRKLSKQAESEIPFPCKLPVTVYRVKTLTVGRLTIKNLDVAAFDLSRAGEGFGEEIVGMLGVPVFEHAVVDIRYSDDGGDDRVAILEPGSFELGEEQWQALGTQDFMPVMQARVNRRYLAPFVVDTGYSGTVAFYSIFAANHDVLEGRPVTEQPSYTVCGESTELVGTVRVFEIGGGTYDGLAVRILAPGSITDVAPGRLGGFVGRKFLESFRVVFDMPHGRIALLEE